jgi:hypothetical protein
MTQTTVRQTVTALDSALTEMTDRLTRAAERVARLDAQIERSEKRLARGTEPTPMEAPAPRRAPRETVPPPMPVDPLEIALAAGPADVATLAKATATSPARVTAALARLRKANRVFNLGSDVAPRWMLVLGDDAPTPALYAAVETMLRERPMTFAELTAATGARRGRLSGVIVQMQRAGRKLANLGTERRARWMLLP